MKIILTVTILAFSVGAASACEFQRTAKTTDKTVVASITSEGTAQMSTPILPKVDPAEPASTPVQEN